MHHDSCESTGLVGQHFFKEYDVKGIPTLGILEATSVITKYANILKYWRTGPFLTCFNNNNKRRKNLSEF